MITPFTTIDIFSPLIELLPSCQVVWWASRGIDKAGSGNATFNLSELSKLLDKTPKTLRAYTYQCQRMGLFRHVYIKGQQATVYYSSLFKVAASRGLTALGASSRIGIRELAHLKYVATEATAEQLQKQSFYARQREKERRSKKERVYMDNVSRVFDQQSSDISRGKIRNVIHIGKRGLFVSDRYSDYGGSQATIADRLGVSESTVCRRLSNAHRRRHNIKLCSQNKKPLHTVEKRQLFRITKKVKPENLDHLRDVAESSFATPNCDYLKRLYAFKGRIFEAKCNLYHLPVELTTKKCAKYRYRKYISSLSAGAVTATRELLKSTK